MRTKELTDVQKQILRPDVEEFLRLRARLNNQIILAMGELGWSMDPETFVCTKPDDAPGQ